MGCIEICEHLKKKKTAIIIVKIKFVKWLLLNGAYLQMTENESGVLT